MSKTVLIVGYGVVGHNLANELKALHPDIYDKYKPDSNTEKKDGKYDFAFICVDTPRNETTPCDITQVMNAMVENDAEIYVIKSTVMPGTTRKAAEALGKRVVFSPEYYGGTQHCNNFDFDFTILGGNKDDCVEVQQLLQGVYDGRHTFKITDSETAELAKYMENSWLATKVSFCNEFANIASQAGVDYEELRECFVLDPRVNPSHTFVYKDKPYWDSHCLNKDVPAIADWSGSEFLRFIIKYNDDAKWKAKSADNQQKTSE